MGVAKARQLAAKPYAQKFATFTVFEANFLAKLKADPDGVVQEISDMYTHLVAGEKRWEVHAHFAVMVTNIVLAAPAIETSLVQWLLRGDEPAPTNSGEGEGTDEDEQAFNGLLEMMAHGDPKGVADRAVESLWMELSIWAGALFQGVMRLHRRHHAQEDERCDESPCGPRGRQS